MSESATPRPVWPAAVCAATSAAFVALGGAFLVGVLVIVHPAVFAVPQQGISLGPHDRGGAEFLQMVLYAATTACFVVAGIALVLGLRRLP